MGDFVCKQTTISIGVLLNKYFYKMAKRTKKVGIVGKYGTRYGASIRKSVKKLEESSKVRYFCTFCGKDSVRRTAAGIWHCKPCRRLIAGAAYSLTSIAANNAKSFIKRAKESAKDK